MLECAGKKKKPRAQGREVHSGEPTTPFHSHSHTQQNGGEKHHRVVVHLGADYEVPHDRGCVQREAHKLGHRQTELV